MTFGDLLERRPGPGLGYQRLAGMVKAFDKFEDFEPGLTLKLKRANKVMCFVNQMYELDEESHSLFGRFGSGMLVLPSTSMFCHPIAMAYLRMRYQYGPFPYGPPNLMHP